MAAIQVFVYLQLLDLLTTLTALRMGGAEMNPLVRWFLQFDPVLGLAAAKLAVCAIALWCVARSRTRALRVANYAFAVVVVWNLSGILLAAGK